MENRLKRMSDIILKDMSMRKRTDDMDLVQYKMEAIERRLDNIERIIFANKSSTEGGINNELMSLVMTLIKQQVVPTPAPVPVQHQSTTNAPATNKQVYTNPNTAPKESSDATVMSSFDMGRRRIIT